MYFSLLYWPLQINTVRYPLIRGCITDTVMFQDTAIENPGAKLYFINLCRRGLSKFYQGKSQTFASLESVKSLEDLAKRGRPKRRRRMLESSKSYGGGLDKRIIYSPKAAIIKKSSRVSLVSSIGRKGTLYLSSFGTSIPVQKSF